MDKKWLFILGGGVLVLLLVVLFSFRSEDKKKQAKSKEDSDFQIAKNTTGYSDSIYPDAPSPFVNSEAEEEAQNLWPAAIKSVKDDAHREKIKEEWRDFVAKYPKNIYVLNEYRQPLTEKEAADRRILLDLVAGVDSFFSREVSRGKYAEGGKDPVVPKEAGVTPDQQKAFFDYKIREIESRIELIQYAREQKALSSDQDRIADKDIAEWKRELEDLQKVAKLVPNT